MGLIDKIAPSPAVKSGIKNYLPHALGEILLIVIGILIAQSVSNWNAERIEKIAELNILRDLREEFINDSLSLETQIEGLTQNVKNISLILAVIEQNKEYSDTLETYFSSIVTPFIWDESKSSYQTLLAKGVDQISNEKIRKQIINLHNNLYQSLKFSGKGIYVSYAQLNEYCSKHFDLVAGEMIDKDGRMVSARMIPRNFTDLRKDKLFFTLIRSVVEQKKVLLALLKYAKSSVNNMTKNLEAEIKS
jgi:hypothetical protein